MQILLTHSSLGEPKITIDTTMENSNGVPIRRGRRSSSRTNPTTQNGRHEIYRRDSNLSTTSFMDEVEMAQDEMFSGPMGESVPTSISSYAHRRSRADSTTSFAYYPDEEDEPIHSSEEDSAIIDDDEESLLQLDEDESADLEAGGFSQRRRTSSGYSKSSVHDRLLRSESAKSDGSVLGRGERTSQKIYIVNEDLTIVVAGFKTSKLGFAIYLSICLMTLGLAYLLFRWLPRWHVRLVGTQCPLRDCTWVVIEVSAPRDMSLSVTDHHRINGVNLWFKILTSKSMDILSPPYLVFPRKDISFLMTRMTIQYLSSYRSLIIAT